MDETEVPRYHCMPDNRGAMATPPWSNEDYLLEQMKAHVSRKKGLSEVVSSGTAVAATHLKYIRLPLDPRYW